MPRSDQSFVYYIESFLRQLRDLNRNDVQAAYEIWAEQYDRDARLNPAVQMDKKIIIQMLNPNKNDVILEFGCGTGRLTVLIAKKCKKIIGIDFSKAMLRVARRKSKDQKNISYKQLDIRKGLPKFKSGSFDKIVCPLVINHVDDTRKLFQESFRLLKNRGIFVFDDINPDGNVLPSHADLVFETSQRGKKIFFHHTIDSLVHGLHRAGFQIERVKFSRVDERLRPLITNSSFERNKGRTFGVIMKARKA